MHRFRWVVCQLDSLAKCRKLDTFRDALASLPKTLDDTYLRILDEVPEQNREGFLRVLQFLLFSGRPLRGSEVADILAISLKHEPAFDPRNRMRPEDIPGVLSSLVTVVEKDDDTTFTLAHFSVKEYLSSPRLETRYEEVFTESISRQSIVKASIAYLSSFTERLSPFAMQTMFPFAGYAARWMDHCRMTEDNEEVQRLIFGFFFPEHQIPYSNWTPLRLAANLYDVPHAIEYDLHPSPIYCASLAGLIRTAEQLIRAGVQVNGTGGLVNTALNAACIKGHKDIARLLLDNGADVNAKVEGGSHTALILAISNLHEELTRLLLKRGANPNVSGYDHGVQRVQFPLVSASCRGSESIVRLLLEHGAKCDTVDTYSGNRFALNEACHAGHRNIVEALLRKGADAEAHGKPDSSTPIIAASRNGHSEIAELLLQYGADPNHTCEKCSAHETALFLACQIRSPKLVEVLCNYGADINALDMHCRTVLYHALQSDQDSMAAFLVRKGAILDRTPRTDSLSNQNFTDGIPPRNSPRPKHADTFLMACRRGLLQVINLLLYQGFNINEPSLEEEDPLQIVAHEGHKELLQLLLNKGANVNSAAGPYGTVLHIASSQGDMEIVKSLLEKGADPNMMDLHRWPARMLAWKNGFMDIADILGPTTLNSTLFRCLHPSALVYTGEYTNPSDDRLKGWTVSTCIPLRADRDVDASNWLDRQVRKIIPSESSISSHRATRLF